MLEFPSVGATENLLMAAVAAKGTTVIDNAAREPEIFDLCQFLGRMGATISGAGTSTLVVEGCRDSPVPAVPPTTPSFGDRIVAATYLAALGVASGDVFVAGARYDHMELLCQKLGEMGMLITPDTDGIRAISPRRLDSVDCSTLPYPGVATDYLPFLVVMLATASGVGIVTENLFPGTLPLRRRTAPHGCRHPHRRPSRGGAGRGAALGGAGPSPRHPGRGRPGGGRARCRRTHRGDRRPSRGPRLRGPGRRPGVARRRRSSPVGRAGLQISHRRLLRSGTA